MTSPPGMGQSPDHAPRQHGNLQQILHDLEGTANEPRDKMDQSVPPDDRVEVNGAFVAEEKPLANQLIHIKTELADQDARILNMIFTQSFDGMPQEQHLRLRLTEALKQIKIRILTSPG